MADDLRMQVLNLHDCFCNANLIRARMLSTHPLAGVAPEMNAEDSAAWIVAQPDPTTVLIGDRFRLERIWWGLTYVLIEAWNARDSAVRAFFDALPATAALQSELDRLRGLGTVKALMEARHYIAHRDRREYWNDGRTAPMNNVADLANLSAMFGAVFLEALDAFKGPGDRSDR